MIFNTQQAIERNGDLGGNRTRDNLIKSHILFHNIQIVIGTVFVKLAITYQYVNGFLSNLLFPYSSKKKQNSPPEIRQTLIPLKYPHDRVNGYVQLTDGDGNFFVPEFNRFSQDSNEGNAIKYAGAFLILSKRLDEANKLTDGSCL